MPTTLPPRRSPPDAETQVALDDARRALDNYRGLHRLYWTLGILSAICILSGVGLLVWVRYFAAPAR